MESIFIECAVRSSLIAAAAGLVLWVMRVKMAAARHAIWTGVTLAMLLLPAFATWGPKAHLAVLPHAAVSAPVVILPPSDHAVAALPFPRTPQQPFLNSRAKGWELIIPALYLAGLFVFLLRLGIGASRARALVRGTISCAAPVTLGWIRPIVILPPDSPQWPQARLDAALAHEREHARRRDPLWQLIGLVNRALFWFHPLAWWLERKLSELAEEACDAAVLARGFDAGNYSECLLDLARSVQRSGGRIGALSATMPGIGLEHRIRTMLSGAIAQRVSRARMMCAVGLCVSAVALFSAGTLVRAQDSAKGGAEFEVASIRPADPNGGGAFKSEKGQGGGAPFDLEHRTFTASTTLYALIRFAYDIRSCRPFQGDCPRISGGPDWIKKDRFNIRAKMPDDSPDYTTVQFVNGQAPRLVLMLQALLADRFNLKIHRETRQLPIYALTVAGKRLKLKQAKDGEPELGPVFRPIEHPNGETTLQMTVQNQSLQEVANVFSMFLDRPVVDRTGLKGKFDFKMEFDQNPDVPALALPGAELGGPALFTAFQEQAGLKLQPTKGPVEVLVIDHAEKPSEN
ncbi:MAG TPA: M56 family metallopeptidase [Bryobacteraceae bacterium]